MKFTKMHGAGNDYIYINCFEEKVEDPSALALRLSNRNFGVGSDGLILICPSDIADCKMDMYNADGSQAQMCGNGIRCVGKYVYKRGVIAKDEITVETLAGIKLLKLNVEDRAVKSVTVDMGAPILEPEKIPVDLPGDDVINRPATIGGTEYNLTCVSMGNPHAVVLVHDVDAMDLQRVGPAFEYNPMFPERTNTEFLQVLDDRTIKMRVWERGAGETLACGTGACASLVAATLLGRCGGEATMLLKGGQLHIRWDKDSNHVFMTGPAEFVFDGQLTQAV